MEKPWEQFRGLVGLTARSGQLIFGESGCVAAIRSGKAALTLVDEGASANTRKRYVDCCRTAGTPLCQVPPNLLGDAAGKPGRMAAVVPQGELARRIIQLLQDQLMDLS